MPDYWTHTLTIKDIAEELALDSDYLYLGTHGPDPFFYVNKLRLFGRKNLSKVGNRIHDTRIRDLFRILFEQSKQAEEPTVEYFAGFVAHYVIDAACHPYVYERTKTGAEHKYLELHLDRYLIEHYFRIDHSPESLRRLIRNVSNADFKRYIAPFYIHICKELYDIELKVEEFESAGKDIGGGVALSLSPMAKKIPFKPWISKLIGIDVNLMIQPDQPDPSIDYELFVALLDPARRTALQAVKDYLAIARTATEAEIEAFLERYVRRDFNGVPLTEVAHRID